MVSQWISENQFAGILITVTPLWFQLPDVSWTRNARLANGNSFLSGNPAPVLCRFGAIKMDTSLVIFSGLPGTGKSTLANKLARQLHWPLLCIDDVIGEVPENAGIAFWDSKVAILLRLVEVQLESGLSVIVDSVFMNMDRHHAQELAHKYQARFLPIYVFISDDKIWEERVTVRFNELNNKDVATWEQIRHQREHFRAWKPDTALFVDSLNPVDQNYEMILNFVMKNNVALKPLSYLPLIEGKYHA